MSFRTLRLAAGYLLSSAAPGAPGLLSHSCKLLSYVVNQDLPDPAEALRARVGDLQ